MSPAHSTRGSTGPTPTLERVDRRSPWSAALRMAAISATICGVTTRLIRPRSGALSPTEGAPASACSGRRMKMSLAVVSV